MGGYGRDWIISEEIAKLGLKDPEGVCGLLHPCY